VASLAQNVAATVVSRDDKWVVVQGRSLVGREPELTALAELVEDAGAGRGRVALITGDAGIGKTSSIGADPADRPSVLQVLPAPRLNGLGAHRRLKWPA
jgi:hypothetical protein